MQKFVCIFGQSWYVGANVQVLEIRPIIKWDKGKALEFLLESLGKHWSNFTTQQSRNPIVMT